MKLHTANCDPGDTISIQNGSDKSIRKIDQFIDNQRIREVGCQNVHWFCDHGISVIPNDTDALLAPVCCQKLNQTDSMLELSQNQQDDRNIENLYPYPVRDGQNSTADGLYTEEVPGLPTVVSREESNSDAGGLTSNSRGETKEECSAFESGNCVKRGKGNTYGILLYPKCRVAGNHMGHVQIIYRSQERSLLPREGNVPSFLMSHQTYISGSREIAGFDTKRTDLLKSLPGLLKGLYIPASNGFFMEGGFLKIR